MTLTTLITVNAILGSALVYALVYVLGHAVDADRRLRATRSAELHALPEQRRDRIAA